jgi:site-specific DNA-methyltransferase (adenine-specific)
MRYLCRLVTPPGGLVFDPFTGSGSTGCGAVLEGLRFSGCDLSEEYVEVARARVAYWLAHPEGPEYEPERVEVPGQLVLPLLGGGA